MGLPLPLIASTICLDFWLYGIYDPLVITYNEAKRQANIVKHSIDLAALSGFFDGDLLTREDASAAYGELRFQSVGWLAEEMLFVVWTPGDGEWPHIISARKAERHEREAWTRFCK